MANKTLFKAIQRNKDVKMNQKITRGIVYNTLTGSVQEQKITDQINSAISCIPGLVIEKMRRATIEETIDIRKIGTTARRPFVLDRNGIYYIAYTFSWNGAPIPDTYYLPVLIVEPGNQLTLNGSDHFLSPIIAKSGISVSNKDIYIWLNKTNWSFMRHNTDFQRQGIQTSNQFLHGFLYQMGADERKRQQTLNVNRKVPNNCPSILYTMAEYGITESFKKYFKADIICEYGTYEEVSSRYSPDEYYIYQASGTKISDVKSKTDWVRSLATLIVRRDQWRPSDDGVLAGVLYLFNIFPQYFGSDWVEMKDSVNYWRLILGHIIWNNDENDGSVLKLVNRHFELSIDVIIDKITRDEFEIDGLNFEGAIDIIGHLIQNSSKLFNGAEVNSLYNKRFCIARYTMAPISYEINCLSFQLDPIKDDPTLDVNKIARQLKRRLRPYHYRRITSTNGEMFTVQSSSDNMLLKVTSVMTAQEKHQKSSNRQHEGMSVLNKAELKWHPSLHHVARPMLPTKPKPSGGDYINPFMEVSPHGILSYSHRDDAEMAEMLAIMRRGNVILDAPYELQLDNDE